MKTKKLSKEQNMLFIILPLAVFFCLSLWYARNYSRVDDMTRIQSKNGVFNLTELDFSNSFVRLQGDVSYIPGILTPEEFKLRENEIKIGNPWHIPSATSRIRIQVPDNKTYMVTVGSIDFSHRAFVNGRLVFEAGVPSETAEEFVPGFAQMAVEVTPENGVIEIIQQGANFVHREGGGHSNLYFGRPETIKPFLALTFGPEYITAGLLAALFLVHLILFIVRRSYKPNLLFSLLCLTWIVRTGLTGVKVFYTLFPALPWQAAFRAEYLTLPAASILIILLAGEVFPGVPQKWFMRAVVAVSAGFSVLCLIADTVILSWVLIPFEGFFTLSIFYLCIRFIMKIPGMVRNGKFQLEQTLSLIGFAFFMAATINDALHHLGVFYYLGFQSSFIMTGLAILIFSFFQMTAMFYGTMRETALAHEKKQRAESEKEMLSEMNRLKNAFYSDLSHEMKTPLTVIAINAQFAAQNIKAGAADMETVTDLDAISAEARRLAQMVTSLVEIGRMQGASKERTELALDPLLSETARIYQSLFARKSNTLTVSSEPNLPFVEGNSDQLIQVLINLFSNANRHTKEGTVDLRAESLEDKVRISVSDSGTGIAPDLLPLVFERHCHGEAGSSGLGLPICKDIIEKHGGEIGIESKEGKGTIVWFTLPAKRNL